MLRMTLFLALFGINYLVGRTIPVKPLSTAAEYGEFAQNLSSADLIFYGYIHGMAQRFKTEYSLLTALHKEGLRYIILEVSPSQAFFLNKFLSTGEDKYLYFGLKGYVAPQDQSIELKDYIKKIRIYNSNQLETDRIKIIGLDKERVLKRKIVHLAHLYSENKTGIPILDSLVYHTELEPELYVHSTYKLRELMDSTVSNPMSLLFPANSQHHFARRFMKFYKANRGEVLNAFGHNSKEVERLLQPEKNSRYDQIMANYEYYVQPLIRKGEKMFASYGYMHIMQDKINGKLPLAGVIKKNYPNTNMVSILNHFVRSKALKLRKSKNLNEYIEVANGIRIRKIKIVGGKYSKNWDGDSHKERVLGVKKLKKSLSGNATVCIDIAQLNDVENRKRYYLDYVHGKNPDKLRFDSDLTTYDYVQYVIITSGSDANTPYELSPGFKYL